MLFIIVSRLLPCPSFVLYFHWGSSLQAFCLQSFLCVRKGDLGEQRVQPACEHVWLVLWVWLMPFIRAEIIPLFCAVCKYFSSCWRTGTEAGLDSAVLWEFCWTEHKLIQLTWYLVYAERNKSICLLGTQIINILSYGIGYTGVVFTLKIAGDSQWCVYSDSDIEVWKKQTSLKGFFSTAVYVNHGNYDKQISLDDHNINRRTFSMSHMWLCDIFLSLFCFLSRVYELSAVYSLGPHFRFLWANM